MTRRRNFVIGVMAVAVVAVIVAFAVLGLGEPPPTLSASPSASSSPSASLAPTLTPAPSETAGPIELAWEPVALEAGAEVGGLAFASGRWFMLGGVEASPEDPLNAAIWTSDDGHAWTRAEIIAVGGENQHSFVNSVVEVGDALVAIGAWGAVQSDQAAWVVWRSTDGGHTWTEDRDGPIFGALNAITPGGAGLVAVGSTFAGTTPYDSLPVDSPSGIEWEATGATLTNSALLDLGTLGDRIAGVGFGWPPDDFAVEPAAWYSEDAGATWTSGRVPHDGREAYIFDLVPFNGGLVAIGYGDGVVAWITVDGATWEPFDVAPTARSMAIGLVGGGLVAVGNVVGTDGSTGPGATWTSTDAQAWLAGPALGDGSVQLIAVAGNADVVLAGGRCQAPGCETVLWRGEVGP